MGTEWLKIWKMFQETPPEIWFCTFWWYPLKPEVKFWKRSLPEVITGNCNLNSFSSDFWYVQSPSVQTLPNHVSLSQNQNPWFYRTSWNCGGWTFWKVRLLRFETRVFPLLNHEFSGKFIDNGPRSWNERVLLQIPFSGEGFRL